MSEIDFMVVLIGICGGFMMGLSVPIHQITFRGNG